MISRTGLKLSVKSLYMDMAVKIQDPRHPPKKQGLRGKLQKSKFRGEKIQAKYLFTCAKFMNEKY